eukprot:SAG25_NODE_198_length_12124_cov_20.420208_15_plen_257_part_00
MHAICQRLSLVLIATAPQSYDVFGTGARAGQSVVHLTARVALPPSGGAGELRYAGGDDEDGGAAVAAQALQRQLTDQLRGAVRSLFDCSRCTEVVQGDGEAAAEPASMPCDDDLAHEASAKPMLLWCMFFARHVRVGGAGGGDEAVLPRGVYVTSEQHWGELDFDAATQEAKALFQAMFPGKPFVPPLPDPDAVPDDEGDSSVLDLGTEAATDMNSSSSFVDTEVKVTFDAPSLGLQLRADEHGLIVVDGAWLLAR